MTWKIVRETPKTVKVESVLSNNDLKDLLKALPPGGSFTTDSLRNAVARLLEEEDRQGAR